MARTKDPHAATVKAWETRRRPLQGTGSTPTQIRKDFYEDTLGWEGARKFEDRRGIEGGSHTILGASHRDVVEIAGLDLSHEQLADLAGAPPGSQVEIEVRLGGGWPDSAVGVHTTFPGGAGESYRIIDGLIIHNQDMGVSSRMQGKGIGTAVLATQVETASRLGFKEIRVIAAGGPSRRGSTNGYYTWALLGFESERRRPGPDNGRPESVQTIMRRPGGPAWWKENGESFFGRFDLSPGSTSMRVFEEYQRLKGLR
ncbi:MAG TPA: hypothetical protein VMZ92_03045 [Planctomycetota bacterium]|nr:hypothetical protein [Planctomycetota bacterium]